MPKNMFEKPKPILEQKRKAGLDNKPTNENEKERDRDRDRSEESKMKKEEDKEEELDEEEQMALMEECINT